MLTGLETVGGHLLGAVVGAVPVAASYGLVYLLFAVTRNRARRSHGLTDGHFDRLAAAIAAYDDDTVLVARDGSCFFIITNTWKMQAVRRYYDDDVDLPLFPGDPGVLTATTFSLLPFWPKVVLERPYGYRIQRDADNEVALVVPRVGRWALVKSACTLLWLVHARGLGVADGTAVDELLAQMHDAEEADPRELDDADEQAGS